jgi:hypothetical protein
MVAARRIMSAPLTPNENEAAAPLLASADDCGDVMPVE